jgi:hypothetical protein
MCSAWPLFLLSSIRRADTERNLAILASTGLDVEKKEDVHEHIGTYIELMRSEDSSSRRLAF